MGALLGRIGYHAGAAGTVTLAKGEKLLHVRALGAAAATLSINGGDAIPIPAGYTFEDFINSGTAEWDSETVLTFTGTLSYFCKTKQTL